MGKEETKRRVQRAKRIKRKTDIKRRENRKRVRREKNNEKDRRRKNSTRVYKEDTIKVISNIKKRRRVSVTTLIILTLIVVGSAVQINIMSNQSILNDEILKLRTRKSNLEEDLRNMEVVLSNSYSISKIKVRAEKMGMGKPMKHQIIYIDIPDVDIVRYVEEERVYIIDGFSEYLKKIFRR